MRFSLPLCTAVCGVAFLAAAPSFLAQDAPAGSSGPAAERIVLAGDSTVAPKTGWGDAFAKRLDPAVKCINMGRGGRSSKSYRDENHWQKVLETKPTWVLIQFGHNDNPGKGTKRETDPKTTFRENLTRYVTEAREAGAKPVLVTPMTRRNFNAEGKIDPAHLEPAGGKSIGDQPDLLTEYSEAARIVAKEQKVPCIDLNARSVELMNRLGPEKAGVFDAATEDPAHPDKVHLSRKGADETVELVVDEIRKKIPGLATSLKSERNSPAAR